MGVLVAATVGLAGCGSSINSEALPLDMLFDDCGGFTMNDDVATVDCVEGRLRSSSRPEVSPLHYVPFRFQPLVAGLSGRDRAPRGEGRRLVRDRL